MPTTYQTDDELDALIQAIVDRDFPDITNQCITITGVLKSTTKGEDDEEVASMIPPAVLKRKSPIYSIWSEVPMFFIVLDAFVWNNSTRGEVVGWIGNALTALKISSDSKSGRIIMKFDKPDLVLFHTSIRKYGVYSEVLTLVEDAIKSGPKADEILGLTPRKAPAKAKTSKAEPEPDGDPEPDGVAGVDGEPETPPADEEPAPPSSRRSRRRSGPPPADETPAEPTDENPPEPAEPAEPAEDSGETPEEPADETPAEPTDEAPPEPADDSGESQPEQSVSRRRQRRGR